MSGLEKFQASESWRTNFKKLLFMERNPLPQAVVKETQRFSLDITEDLQIILEEKRIPKSASETVKSEEQIERQSQHDMAANNEPNASRPLSICDDTIFNEIGSTLNGMSDESFEVMERMCDKTASDPNSTLFQYLHGDNQELVMAEAKKKCSIDGKSDGKTVNDAEAESLQRLLDELRVEEQQQLENESPLKGIDCTQLADIEAPSRFWETTITGSGGSLGKDGDKSPNLLKTSPVKMVGLLRPSTILEECGPDSDASSDFSSLLSFQTTLKEMGSDEQRVMTAPPSEASTSCYDTASDFTADYSKASASSVSKIELFSPPVFVSNIEMAPNENSSKFNESINLIDLEQTFAPLRNSPSSSLLDETIADQTLSLPQTKHAKEAESDSDIESIIELLSEGEDEETRGEEQIKENVANVAMQYVPETYCKVEPRSLGGSSTRSSIASSLLSQSSSLDQDGGNDDKENEQKSLQFNDTMEEVDYILAKGLQYMTANAADAHAKSTALEAKEAAALLVNATTPLKAKQNTFLLSPNRSDRYRSPSPMLYKQTFFQASPKSKTQSSTTFPSLPKPKPVNRFALDIKPFPKLDVFKKPTASGILRHKEAMHKQFPNVVSPVGAYMKKTGTSPLMCNLKPTTRHANIHNSVAYRALEYESRLYQPNFQGGNEPARNGSGKNLASLQQLPERRLPKKAYLSSEVKQIVDERTPVTIPGGKKIQKYIENALLPAVVRHEGKIKMSEVDIAVTEEVASMQQSPEIGESSTPLDTPQKRPNASLANLSVMSGDVSVYTIMDAQKF